MNRVKYCTHDKCARLMENLPGLWLQNWTSLWPALNPLIKCQSYRESNKRSKEGQGPNLGVSFIEVSVL